MEKILIIDDSLVQAAHLSSILKADYDITTVHTAEEGLSLAGSGEYSLVLLDVVMPGMDGFTVLKSLQEEVATMHTPVILITSLTDSQSEERGLALGAVDYISKPFHPMIVKARVNTHIKLFQYRKQVEYQSMTDQMTGVANRWKHDQLSIMRWQEAARLQIPFSICMFDIDHFKQYNDTFGHPAGDQVITAVAHTANSYFQRSTDFFARYGGEEFVAFTLGSSSSEAFEHLIKIRRAVEDLRIPHNEKVSEWVTVSIGGVTVVPPAGGPSYEHYLKIADTMLYDAKRFGRNRVVWANEKMMQMCEK